jgi:predicted ATP-grasp superfamily ATP-dependent carboligase
MFVDKLNLMVQNLIPGANPTVESYNASVVKIYKAINI